MWVSYGWIRSPLASLSTWFAHGEGARWGEVSITCRESQVRAPSVETASTIFSGSSPSVSGFMNGRVGSEWSIQSAVPIRTPGSVSYQASDMNCPGVSSSVP